MTCWLKVLLHPIMFRPKHEMLSMVHREMERNEFQLTVCPVQGQPGSYILETAL